MWQAWQALQTCRPIGMAVGAIPWTAIREYAVAYEVEDWARFEHLVRVMDREWFAAQARQRENGGDGRRGPQTRR